MISFLFLRFLLFRSAAFLHLDPFSQFEMFIEPVRESLTPAMYFPRSALATGPEQKQNGVIM